MQEKFWTWVRTSERLPSFGQTVIFLTESLTSAVGCLQEEGGRNVWYTEFAPWGDHEVDMPLDPDDPEKEITHWMAFHPPRLPGF